MDFDEALKELKDDPELAKKLEEAARNEVEASDFRGTLVEGGMGAEAIESLLTEYQRRRGAAIGAEKVDEGTLRMVAGGDSKHYGGCTENYFKEQCAATVESGSWCGSNDKCVLFSVTYSYATSEPGVWI